MFHDKYRPPEPPPHNHSFGEPIQSYPIRDNCCDAEPMGWDGGCCNGGGRGAAPARDRGCSPLPPPIPPVRYIPGMDVQEQLCNMAERVNICVDRWNKIQANCYEALNQCVGAAVNNDVYYSECDVKYSSGYSEEAGCSYSIVEARPCDASGRPIICRLRPAYNNLTNSGAVEPITDVSFVTSAQVAITAVQASNNRWKGTSLFGGNPGNSMADDTVWICGWTSNGVLRFFRGDVDVCHLQQNRMVDVIGPVFPIIKDGKPFEEVLSVLDESPASIQAMGYKPNGRKVFFNCSFQNDKGMTPRQVATTMQGFGCATAVITSVQTAPVSVWEAEPISGTEYVAEDCTNGLVGGMTYLGTLTEAPIGWQIPANCAAWIITKRPCNGWRNAFTSEIANVVQKLGQSENKLNATLGQLAVENENISKLQYQVLKNTDDIEALDTKVSGFDERISDCENKVSDLETLVNESITQIPGIVERLDTLETKHDEDIQRVENLIAEEESKRISADDALRSAITAEESARKAQDVVLLNKITEETNLRTAEDSAIRAALDTERTQREQADRELQEAIDGIKSGDDLPIATQSQLGVIKVGKNLTIEGDGTLNAQAGGGGGADVIEGTGITITDEETGEKKISADMSVLASKADMDTVKADLETAKTDINSLETSQGEQDTKITNLTTAVNNHTTQITDITENITNIKGDITEVNSSITNLETTVNNITNGTGLPIASADTLGAIKIGANLSISEDGTLSAKGSEGPAGETVAQGEGITVTHDSETNVATVALNEATKSKLAEVDDKASVEALAGVEGKADKNTADIAGLTTKVTANEGAIAEVNTKVEENTSSIDSINTALGGKINTNNGVATGTLKLNGASLQFNDASGEAKQAGISVADGKVKFTGTNEGTTVVTGVSTPTAASDAVNKGYVDSATSTLSDTKVSKSGDTMSGNLVVPAVILKSGTSATAKITGETSRINVSNVNSQDVNIRGVANPVNTNDAVNKETLDAEVSRVEGVTNELNDQVQDISGRVEAIEGATTGGPFLPLKGGTLTGPLSLSRNTYLSFLNDVGINPVVLRVNVTADEGSVYFTFAQAANSEGITVDGIANPTGPLHAVNLRTLQSAINEAIDSSWAKSYTPNPVPA